VITRLLLGVAVLASGLGTGVMLSTAIGMVPMTLALPYDRYVEMIQFMWPRYDPLMPLMNGLAFVLDVVLAVVTGDGAARPFLIAGAVLLATVMVISVVKNVPINKYVNALDPGRQPADWATADPRLRWRSWNLIRTSFAVGALAANVLAAVAR
jgi:uncharacterized membrane protein